MLNTLKKIPIYAWTWLITLLSLTFFIGINQTHISSDGVGYYDYLPSAFIYKDLNRGVKWHEQIQRTDTLEGYVSLGPARVIKYPAGAAILLSPFFAGAYLVEKISGNANITGYEQSFHNGVWLGALVYFLLSLWLFQLTLKALNISIKTQWFATIGLGLATNVIQYINGESAFSHVYGHFLSALWVYLAVTLKPLFFSYLYLTLILGLIYITRPVDLLVVASLPFLLTLHQSPLETIKPFFKNRKWQGGMVLVFLAFVFLQSYLWYLQTDKWWIDTYANEHFNFSKPFIGRFLFSYKKGWFLYTPFLILSAIAIPVFVFKKQYNIAITAFAFLLVVVYVLSSWEIWWYNCGFGQRSVIDFYPIFFISIALFFEMVGSKIQKVLWVFLGLCILLNHIQARQYRTHIINWEGMDKAKYWNVFLSNSNRFIGFGYKNEYDFNKYQLLYSQKIADQKISPNDSLLLAKVNLTRIVGNKEDLIFKISSLNNFERSNRAKIGLEFKRKGIVVDKKSVLFTNLSNTFLGNTNYGYYVFELSNKKPKPDEIVVFITTKGQDVNLRKTYMSIWEPK